MNIRKANRDGKILKTKALEIQELKELVIVKSLPDRY